MKRCLFILSFLAITFSSFGCYTAFANTESLYAKIENYGVYFCSSPNESSAVFEIPYSYFVKVDKIVDDYFLVVYKQLSGYVKKDKVSLMKGKPTQPYSNASIENFVDTNLYQQANSTSTETLHLTENTTLSYYGTIVGEQLSSKTNQWYYCSVSNDSETIYGYVYSSLTDFTTPLSTNNERFEIVDESIFSNVGNSSEFSQLSTGTKIMLIVSISVPSLFILYFLIKPSKIAQAKNKEKQQKQIKRHGDYFEFDESEL
ncbi:MAG: hypothetical protein E7375_01440 [Clostridiales bacterium]|nr:hypothetical protein [Clostridiales bacterium]